MKRLALAALAVLPLAATACGGSGNAAAPQSAPSATVPRTTTSGAATGLPPAHGCVDASAALLARIRRNVVLDGARLGHVRETLSGTAPRVVLVSAVVTGGGADGMVATWAAERPDGRGKVYAIDRNAALVSQFGSGITADPRLVVQLPGVYRSRVCAGGPHVSHGLTAPASTRGAGSRS